MPFSAMSARYKVTISITHVTSDTLSVLCAKAVGVISGEDIVSSTKCQAARIVSHALMLVPIPLMTSYQSWTPLRHALIISVTAIQRGSLESHNTVIEYGDRWTWR